MKTALTITNLSHQYVNAAGTRAVLDHVDLSVQPGQMIGVFGDSGAGKTTLLLNSGTMLKPTEGDVEIQGLPVYDVTAGERAQIRAHKIGYLFQTLQLIPYLTLQENLRLPSGSSVGAADTWLDRVGLADWAQHKPDALSHGQRQRGALARALVHQPELVIADEPTGNLDRKNGELVFRVLREFADSGGAVLVASHDDSIEAYADRCFDLQDGSLTEKSRQP